MFEFKGLLGLLLDWLFFATAIYLGGATNKQGAKASNAGISSANNLSSLLSGNASGLESTLTPQLESQLVNPSGYGATDLAAMTTAAGEGAAGATAGAQGAMRRAAARTRNAGGYAAAEDEAARSGQRAASTAGLSIASQNANLKQQQKEEAAKGLEGLYGTDIGASVNALGLVPGMINAGTNASKLQGGLLSVLQPLNSMAAQDAALA